MNINITARRSKITPEVRKYCQKRIKLLEKILGYPLENKIIISVEKFRHKAEIHIKRKGTTLNSAEESNDILTSLGRAFDNMEKRVKKEQEKLREGKRRRNKEMNVFPSVLEVEEEQRKIIRSNLFSLKPMSIEEAVIQFENSKREVLMFRRFESEKWAVLYLRKDGNYGLVEPD